MMTAGPSLGPGHAVCAPGAACVAGWMRVAGLVLGLALAAPAVANDFPTRARAEYVFACMSANGQSMEILDKCSCSVDVIAERMKYREYLDAETMMRMRQLRGDRAAIFRNSEWAKQTVDKFQAAQAEAEVRCF